MVRDHILKANPNNRHQVENDLKAIETFYSDPNSIGSANTFNNVLHNPNYSYTPKELKIICDRLEPSLRWFDGHV